MVEQQKVKRTRRRKPGSGAKYGVNMPSFVTLRMTSTQKAQVMSAGEVSGAGTASDYWRGLMLEVSQGVMDLKSGLLSAEDFKTRYGEVAYNLVKSVD